MKKHYSIAIDILLQTPMHISSMEEGRYMPGETGTRKIRRTSERIGVPITLTRELEVVLPQPITIGDGEESFLKYTTRVPVIPANSIGGRLRRCAAELITEALVAQGMTLSPRAYNTLSAGSPDASLDRSEATMDQVLAAKKNAYFGLFGGTSYALSANLVVHEGYPICETTAPLLSIPAITDAAARDFEMTSVVELTKKDDIKDMRNPAMLEAVVGVEQTAEYIQGIMKGREEKAARKGKEGDDGKKTELTTVAALHVVNPGLKFALRFDVKSDSPDQIGLLLLSLQRFFTNGQIGGKAAKGYGHFASLNARLFNHENGARSTDGVTIWSRDASGAYVFADHPEISAAVNAAQTFVDTADSAEIERFASADAKGLFKRTREAA